MELSVETHDGIAVVTLFVDELDASNSPEFKQQMAPVLAAHRHVVIDLEHVRFIDSSGLGAMLSCLRQLTAKGGDLALCGLSKSVRAAFELVRLHRVLDIRPTRAEAIEAFRS
jgi:anti-sigma B factor antagonist